MLDNWLHPINPTDIVAQNELQEYALLHHIDVHSGHHFPSLKDTQVAIIGLDDHANHIRRFLYQLSWHFKSLKCADLGNIRNKNDHFITQALTELIDGGITPIIIGGNHVKAIPQFLAHKGVRPYSNIALISEFIPYLEKTSNEKFYLKELIDKYKSSIFNISFLGFQNHFCSPHIGKWIDENRFDGLRLGKVKSNIEEAEPVIRDADMLIFQLDALKHSDCPGIISPTPNGLPAEKACQLSRYAGMSDKLGSISISGYYPKTDIGFQSAQLIAQMVWYFMDGYVNRKKDYPVTNTGMTEYVVDFKDIDYQITFWKSNRSGRWWMQIPVKNLKGLNRHRLIPCSYQDYKLSCSGELPERLLLALDRFS